MKHDDAPDGDAKQPATYPKTKRNTVRRLAKRGVYDEATVHAILDEALVCHVGFVVVDETTRSLQPYVVPMAFGRAGHTLYLHGNVSNRMLKHLAHGAADNGADEHGEHGDAPSAFRGQATVTVTLADGLVLARSLFHSSINYRSVMLFGTTRRVTDPAEIDDALRCISEHICPGRWDDVRPTTPAEIKATSVLAFDISEASAKVRTGGPNDEAADLEHDVWSGVLPISTVYETGALQPDAANHTPSVRSRPPPEYITQYDRKRWVQQQRQRDEATLGVPSSSSSSSSAESTP